MQGDDWAISATLIDANGVAVNLTGAELEWALVGPDGNPVALAEADATITVISPPTAGLITINLANSVTSTLDAGRYFDTVRVFVTGITTDWLGNILVDASAFEA